MITITFVRGNRVFTVAGNSSLAVRERIRGVSADSCSIALVGGVEAIDLFNDVLPTIRECFHGSPGCEHTIAVAPSAAIMAS